MWTATNVIRSVDALQPCMREPTVEFLKLLAQHQAKGEISGNIDIYETWRHPERQHYLEKTKKAGQHHDAPDHGFESAHVSGLAFDLGKRSPSRWNSTFTASEAMVIRNIASKVGLVQRWHTVPQHIEWKGWPELRTVLLDQTLAIYDVKQRGLSFPANDN